MACRRDAVLARAPPPSVNVAGRPVISSRAVRRARRRNPRRATPDASPRRGLRRKLHVARGGPAVPRAPGPPVAEPRRGARRAAAGGDGAVRVLPHQVPHPAGRGGVPAVRGGPGRREDTGAVVPGTAAAGAGRPKGGAGAGAGERAQGQGAPDAESAARAPLPVPESVSDRRRPLPRTAERPWKRRDRGPSARLGKASEQVELRGHWQSSLPALSAGKAADPCRGEIRNSVRDARAVMGLAPAQSRRGLCPAAEGSAQTRCG